MGQNAALVIRVKQGKIKWGPEAHSTGNLLKGGVVISVDEEDKSFAAFVKKLNLGGLISGWTAFIGRFALPIPGSYRAKEIKYTGTGSRV